MNLPAYVGMRAREKTGHFLLTQLIDASKRPSLLV
jgi:hypothetical protein